MPPESRLSPKDRRVVLEQLPHDRLAELTAHFDLDVGDRRSRAAHVDAIVRKKSLKFPELLNRLRTDELQEICRALALGTGRDKATLVSRIMRVPAEAQPPAAATTSSAPPPSGQSGSAVKSLLRRFVIRTAAEYLGRDAWTQLTPRLLQCFGWPESGPAEAEMPASLSVVEGGQRATRLLRHYGFEPDAWKVVAAQLGAALSASAGLRSRYEELYREAMKS